MKTKKRNTFPLFIFLYLLTVNCSLLSGLDLSLRTKGFASLPMGSGNTAPDGNEMYNMGGGGSFGIEIDSSSFFSNPLGFAFALGAEGSLLINPFLGDNKMNINFYSLGGSLGMYFFPLSRLFIRIDGIIGVYQSSFESSNDSPALPQPSMSSQPGLFWQSGGEIGFRFTPGFLISANAGWRQYDEGWGFNFINDTVRVLNSGYYAGLTVQTTIRTGRRNNEGINASLHQTEPVYPAFMQIYHENSIGTVVIRNNENAEIRDVRMYFRAPPYTVSQLSCGSVSIIPRGRSTQLPLYADFSPEILRFTGSGRIMGELVIRYRFLGQERESVRAVTVAAHNRNRITSQPLDTTSLAAFISPTSPETLDFARFIAGLARANRVTGHNPNMQYAIWLFEGLRSSNIYLGETYTDETHVQFPSETLLFRTGSSRDLALLIASCLEGVGISSAFIQIENDFLVAVNLNIGQAAAETLFNGIEKILIINDSVWLPLSMNAFNNGFIAAWTQGTAILNETFTAGKDVDFIIVEDAWAFFPPAPLPGLSDRNIIHTDIEAAANEVYLVVWTYMIQEILPLIEKTRNELWNNRSGSPGEAALNNRLGILYIRSGQFNEGKAAYERAAMMGFVPAMTNRGNLALIENDFIVAEQWFKLAFQHDSQNQAAIRGLNRVEGSR